MNKFNEDEIVFYRSYPKAYREVIVEIVPRRWGKTLYITRALKDGLGTVFDNVMSGESYHVREESELSKCKVKDV